MSGTLYLDQRDLELSLRGKALFIHRDGELNRSLPLNLVQHIVCHSSVAIRTSLLANLAHQGIGLTLFGGRHARLATHLGTSGTQDVNRRLGQYRHYLDPHKRLAWAVRLMQHKLLQQLRLLHKARRERPDLRHPLTQAIARLRDHIQELKQQPPTNLDSLRGIEGSAGRFYFQAYARLFADSLGFRGRQRRPPPDPVNALLSLGYTLLHGDLQQAISSVGLDPMLGLYHEPAHGRPSLVSDLIEPWRPRIDALVWALTRTRVLTADHFTRDKDSPACLLNKEGRAIFYPLYEANARTWRAPLRRQMLLVAKAMQDPSDRQTTTDTDDDELPFGPEED